MAKPFFNVGSIEGQMEAIKGHSGNTFMVRDRVSGALVRCEAPDTPEWAERVRCLLQRRVLVSGEVHHAKTGVPRLVANVLQIEETTPGAALLLAEFGSIPDTDAASDPVAFLRTVRVELPPYVPPTPEEIARRRALAKELDERHAGRIDIKDAAVLVRETREEH